MWILFVVLHVKTLTFSKPFIASERTQHGSSINQSACLREFSTPQDWAGGSACSRRKQSHVEEQRKNVKSFHTTEKRVQLSVRPVICKLCFLWPATQRVFFLVHYPSKCQCSPNRSAKFKQRKSYLFLWNSVVCLQTWFHANRMDQTWGGHVGCAHPHYAFFVIPWDKTEAW